MADNEVIQDEPINTTDAPVETPSTVIEQAVNPIVTDAVNKGIEVIVPKTNLTTDDAKALVSNATTIVTSIKQSKWQSPVLWVSFIAIAFLGYKLFTGDDLSGVMDKVTAFAAIAMAVFSALNNPTSANKL